MKEIYKIKRPDHVVFGDPLYFEQFKGARLKKLVADYHVLTKFDTARLVLEEKPFSNCPDMMNRTMTLYFGPEKHMDVYLSEQMYEGQEEKTKVVLVDTARYLLKVDDRSDEIHTGADGEWGFFSEVYHKNGEHRISDAVIITIAVPDDKDFTAMREMARYFFQDMEPLMPEKHRTKSGPER